MRKKLLSFMVTSCVAVQALSADDTLPMPEMSITVPESTLSIPWNKRKKLPLNREQTEIDTGITNLTDTQGDKHFWRYPKASQLNPKQVKTAFVIPVKDYKVPVYQVTPKKLIKRVVLVDKKGEIYITNSYLGGDLNQTNFFLSNSNIKLNPTNFKGNFDESNIMYYEKLDSLVLAKNGFQADITFNDQKVAGHTFVPDFTASLIPFNGSKEPSSPGSNGSKGKDGFDGRRGGTGRSGSSGRDGRSASYGGRGGNGSRGGSGGRGYDGKDAGNAKKGTNGARGYDGKTPAAIYVDIKAVKSPFYNDLFLYSVKQSGEMEIKDVYRVSQKFKLISIGGNAGAGGIGGDGGRGGDAGAGGTGGAGGAGGDGGRGGRGKNGRNGRNATSSSSGTNGTNGSRGGPGGNGSKGGNGGSGGNGGDGGNATAGSNGGRGGNGAKGGTIHISASNKSLGAKVFKHIAFDIHGGKGGPGGNKGHAGRAGKSGAAGTGGSRGRGGSGGGGGTGGSGGSGGRSYSGGYYSNGRYVPIYKTGGVSGISGWFGNKGSSGSSGRSGSRGKSGNGGRSAKNGSNGRAGNKGAKGSIRKAF